MIRKILTNLALASVVATPLITLSCAGDDAASSPEKALVNEVINSFNSIDLIATGKIKETELEEISTSDPSTQIVYKQQLTNKVADLIGMPNYEKYLENPNLTLTYSLSKEGVRVSTDRYNWEYQFTLYVEYVKQIEQNSDKNFEEGQIVVSKNSMISIWSERMQQDEISSWLALTALKTASISYKSHIDILEQMLTWKDANDTLSEHASLPSVRGEEQKLNFDFFAAERLGIDFDYLLSKKIFDSKIFIKYSLQYDWPSGNDIDTNVDKNYNITFEIRYGEYEQDAVRKYTFTRQTRPSDEVNELDELAMIIENSGMKYIRSTKSSSILDQLVTTPTNSVKFNFNDIVDSNVNALGLNVETELIGDKARGLYKFRFVEGKFTLRAGKPINGIESKKVYELHGVLRVANKPITKTVKLNIYSSEVDDHLVYDRVMKPLVDLELRPYTGSDDIETLRSTIVDKVNELKVLYPNRIISIEDDEEEGIGSAFSFDINLNSSMTNEEKDWEIKKLRSLQNNKEWMDRDPVINAEKLRDITRFLDKYDTTGIMDFPLLSGNGQVMQVPGRNLIITVEGVDESEFIRNKHIIFGSHIDIESVRNRGADARGHSDNLSGVASNIALMEEVIKKPLPYTTKFAFFDAEEVGQIGSQKYINSEYLFDDGVNFDDLKLYVDLNSVVGGDYTYVAHGTSKYKGDSNKPQGQNGDRREYFNLILKAAEEKGISLRTSNNVLFDENGNPTVYPYGKTNINSAMPISDFASFSNEGVQIISLFSANNDIWGLKGKEPFYQTAIKDERFWFPDPTANLTPAEKAIGIVGGPFNIPGVNKGGYPRVYERGWGRIYSSNGDSVDYLNSKMPSRVTSQLEQIHNILLHLIYVKITTL